MNPLEMPEVVGIVASYLKGEDLARCVRVSKSWHTLYMPYRWRTIEAGVKVDSKFHGALGFPCYRLGPHPTYIYHHRHLIRELLLQGDSAGLDKYRYPQMRKLTIDFMWGTDGYDREVFLEFKDMFPSLDELELRSVKVQGASWLRLLGHSHITTVRLSSMEIKAADTPAFWRVCSNLECLELREVSIQGGWTSTDMTFARLRNLTLVFVGPQDCEKELRLILQCPELRGLLWSSDYMDDHPSILTRNPILSNHHWPHLNQLTIYCALHDTDLAFILKRVGKLMILRVGSCLVMDQTSQALVRHFPTLVELEICSNKGVLSQTYRDVLCNSPRLRSLYGSDILARDIIDGGPWVCHQLQDLRLCFLFGESEQHLQPEIFERLSTLVQLKNLSMSAPQSASNGERLTVLEFRLDQGLGQLASLHKMGWVMFEQAESQSNVPQLGPKEIEWIQLHWKGLFNITGVLSSDPQLNIKLNQMLVVLGIRR